MGDTSASPFHCYNILVEHILEPDQENVKEILQQGILPSVLELYVLVSDYFNNNVEASTLLFQCSISHLILNMKLCLLFHFCNANPYGVFS